MAIENEDCMNECSLKQLWMETVRMKQDNDTQEEGKKRRLNMGRSTVGTKNEVLTA